MRIFVKVKANAKEEKVEKIGENNFKVRVNAPPVDGKANQAAIKLLAVYFDVPPSQVKIISGHTSRQKVFEII